MKKIFGSTLIALAVLACASVSAAPATTTTTVAKEPVVACVYSVFGICLATGPVTEDVPRCRYIVDGHVVGCSRPL